MAGSNSKKQIARLGQDEWASRAQAAEELGVGVLRIDWLVSNGHLEPAETETYLPDLDVRGYEVGVTRSSLQTEKQWRRNVSRWRRWGRALRDLLETSGL
ncbi:MAG TPA: hypothetical protein VFH59_01670 [Frateuria sp.]|uniref:hypothetical protein n=1 Tax=Frateuria sp. TaxID=2211372 RepID=UPI002D7E5F52|nr:hypothetical protein [Frateuria sp.]HET6804137.1 hypothetical protein [Frateuria sp.]